MRILIYIALLVITGCTYSSSKLIKGLDDAQALMETNPRAAFEKLNALDVTEFQDSATMARWALLYSEAMAANNLCAPTDTIISIALDYYKSHNLTKEYQHAARLKTLIRNGDKNNALASALYIQKEKEFMLYKERVKREQLITFGLIILLIASGIIVWMRQRLKLQSARNDALMAEAYALKEQVGTKDNDVSRLESTLHGLLENRFALIDSLCQTYYESQGTKTERKAIADKVKAEIDKVRNESFLDMEHAVNDCRNNILLRIKEAHPDIKDDDYKLAVYLASRLSSRTISLLLGESIDVVYKRKSRLKKRITDTVHPKNDDFVGIF